MGEVAQRNPGLSSFFLFYQPHRSPVFLNLLGSGAPIKDAEDMRENSSQTTPAAVYSRHINTVRINLNIPNLPACFRDREIPHKHALTSHVMRDKQLHL